MLIGFFFAEDIAKKLNDIQTKIPSIDQQKRKQDDLLGNINKQQELLKTIDSKMNYLTQNDPKKRSDQPGKSNLQFFSFDFSIC